MSEFNEADVRSLWRCARAHNSSIPDEALDAIRDTLLAALRQQGGMVDECYACEGRPGHGNSPCVVCGKQAALAQNTQGEAVGHGYFAKSSGELTLVKNPEQFTLPHVFPLYAHAERATVPDADAARFRFVVEHNWIGAKTRCERRIQDSDLGSARQAVDAASLAAVSPQPIHKRVFVGPGHLEQTGYIDPSQPEDAA